MALTLVNDFFSNLAHSTACRGFLRKLLLFVKLLPEEEGGWTNAHLCWIRDGIS